MMFKIALSALLVLLVIVVAAAFLLFRWPRGGALRFGRRPRKRHAVVRILCGLVGVAILTAVAVGSSQAVRRSYNDRRGEEGLTVRVPTRTVPQLPIPKGKGDSVKLGEARLLAYVVILDVTGGSLRPIFVDQHDVRWPRDRNRRFDGHARVESLQVDYDFAIQSLESWRSWEWEEPAALLNVRGMLNWQDLGPNGHGWGQRSFDALNPVVTALSMGSLRADEPLSIVQAAPRHLKMLCLFVRAAEEDPLLEQPLAEFVKSRETEVRTILARDHSSVARSRFWRDGQVGALALVQRIGLSALFLSVGAVLLTQVFARRSAAFVGVVAAVVLYVAALDRAALETHFSHLRDANAPPGERILACTLAGDTFFFRSTAWRRLQEASRDEKTPAEVREAAAQAAAQLAPRP